MRIYEVLKPVNTHNCREPPGSYQLSAATLPNVCAPISFRFTQHYLMKPNVSSSLVGLTLLHFSALFPIFSYLTGVRRLLRGGLAE